MATDIFTDTGYIYDPITTDPDALQQEAFEYIQARWPDWVPHESNLEAWLIAACARMVAEARDIASEVPPAIFRFYGAHVLGLPPIDATPATVDSTWALSSNPAGRTIDAGTFVAIPGADGEPLTFEVASDVIVIPGDLSVGSVTLRSQDEGAFTSGLGGVGVVVEQLDPPTWISSVTLSSATGGGTDGESDDEYLDRLSRRLTLLTPRPILPRDFEVLAMDLGNQLGINVRVLAIDGYDPGDSSTDNERMVTLIMMDDDTGEDILGANKTAIATQLQELREVNFVVNTADPDRHVVGFAFHAHAYPGFDNTIVNSDGESALTNFVSSANWGRLPGAARGGWYNRKILRIQDAYTALNNVDGLDYVESLTVTVDGVDSTTDVTLTGVAPVTAPDTTVGAILGTTDAA